MRHDSTAPTLKAASSSKHKNLSVKKATGKGAKKALIFNLLSNTGGSSVDTLFTGPFDFD
jgi:hypothetical protein